MHDEERVGAFETRQNGLDRLDEGVGTPGSQSDGGFFSKKFRNDFGVGLSVERGSGFFKLVGDFYVVFYDAVMHEEKSAFAVGMRMGVFKGYASMGCPAGVRDAVRKFGFGFSGVGDFVHQCRYLAYRFEGFHSVRRVSDGDSGGIVSAVFEPFEPMEEDLVGVFAVTRVGEDSAHGLVVMVGLWQWAWPVIRPRLLLLGFWSVGGDWSVRSDFSLGWGFGGG